MSLKAVIRSSLFVLMLGACTTSPFGNASNNGKAPTTAANGLGKVPQRTLVQRPLMPTSPQNLLRDPFIGGDGDQSYGKFLSFYDNGNGIPLHRTFQSVSPIGGAVSISELRNLPLPLGASEARIIAAFPGGSGSFHASLWLSAGDGNANPIPFASASGIEVALLDGAGTSKVVLSAQPVVVYGARQWVQFVSTSDSAFPAGGWFSITVTNFSLTWQFAAPEVTTSTLTAQAPSSNSTAPVTMSNADRTAILQVGSFASDTPPAREVDDR